MERPSPPSYLVDAYVDPLRLSVLSFGYVELQHSVHQLRSNFLRIEFLRESEDTPKARAVHLYVMRTDAFRNGDFKITLDYQCIAFDL